MPKILSNISIPVLFTDDMSIIVTDYSVIDFQTNIKEIFELFNKWFILNLLSLNSDKINFINFKMRNTHSSDMKVENDNRFVASTPYTNLLPVHRIPICCLYTL